MTNKRVYINHIHRLQAERDTLKAALIAERRMVRKIAALYRKRMRSRFWWLIDFMTMQNKHRD